MESPSLERPHKFLALDALRGIAALLVVPFHFRDYFHGLFPSRGYLAVDLFFLLSGFVLTFAYQQKLDSGYPSFTFAKVRFVRLYPLYVLGMTLGFVWYVAMSRHTHFSDFGTLCLWLVCGLLMLPLLPFHGTALSASFPLNYAMWSLFMEDLANAFHALFARRRGLPFLLIVCALAGSFVAYETLRHGVMIGGSRRGETLLALPRTLFSYTLGMILFRVWRAGRFRWNLPAPALGLLLIGLLLLPELLAHFHLPCGGTYDLLMVMCFFPLLVLTAAASTPSPALQGSCRQLGILSYAVYALHVPLGGLLQMLWPHLRHRSPAHDAPWSGAIFLLLLVAFCLLADRYYDLPLRAWLRNKLLPQRG